MDPFGHQRKVMQVTGSIDLRMTLHDRVVARHPNDLDLDPIGWLAGKNHVGDQATQEFFFFFHRDLVFMPKLRQGGRDSTKLFA